MKISGLIEMLQGCLEEGDREVMLEVGDKPAVGYYRGNVRDALEALVLVTDECDKPSWIP